MIELTTLHESLVGEIRDLYGAEKQLLSTLARIAPQLRDAAVRDLASRLLNDTGNQLWRLEEVFALLDEEPGQRHSLGMARILDDRKEPRDRGIGSADASFTAQAGRAVHFLAAVHSTAAARARALDYDDVALLLHESADEALTVNRRLSTLAAPATGPTAAM